MIRLCRNWPDSLSDRKGKLRVLLLVMFGVGARDFV